MNSCLYQYKVQNLTQALLFAGACSFLTALFIVWKKRKNKTFLSNTVTKYFKIPTSVHFIYLFENDKKIRLEANEKITFFQYLQKYDNHTCNESIASLGTCGCDRMLLSVRIDEFWVNVMAVSQETVSEL